MPIQLVVEDVKSAGRGIWIAPLSPSEVRSLGQPTKEGVGRSVIGVRKMLAGSDTKIAFEQQEVSVFLVGTAHETVIVEVQGADQVTGIGHRADVIVGRSSNFSEGDNAFLSACRRFLTDSTAKIAEELLSGIRCQYRGEMHEGNARKWINRPENFFTITIQNRNDALRISIRGAPNRHASYSLEIKRGRTGYSEFVLNSRENLPEAIALLESAARQ